MLKIVLNRLKPQVEKIITEEQACFRAGRSTSELLPATALSTYKFTVIKISSTNKASIMSS